VNVYPLLLPDANCESIKHAAVEVGIVVPVQVPDRFVKAAAKPTVG
jgi:hypothetical protein